MKKFLLIYALPCLVISCGPANWGSTDGGKMYDGTVEGLATCGEGCSVVNPAWTKAHHKDMQEALALVAKWKDKYTACENK